MAPYFTKYPPRIPTNAPVVPTDLPHTPILSLAAIPPYKIQRASFVIPRGGLVDQSTDIQTPPVCRCGLSSDVPTASSANYPLSSTKTAFECVVNHVFLPIYDAKHNNYAREHVYALVHTMHTAARDFNRYIDEDDKSSWQQIMKMLKKLQAIVTPSTRLMTEEIISQLGAMDIGDMLVFPGPGHGVTIWKQDHCILFESLGPQKYLADGCSATREYPCFAIEIASNILDNADFRRHIASSICVGSNVERLIGILRIVGRPVEPKHLTKRIYPNYASAKSWSVPSLWFLVKLAIQSSFHPSLGHSTYKSFMLFFMRELAERAVKASSPSIMLHSMATKILRRFRKLTVPQWLHDMVLGTCTALSQILHQRWQEVQAVQPSVARWEPSQFDLIRETQFSLPRVYDYISSSPMSRGSDAPHTQASFLRSTFDRGTLSDFLSNPDKFFTRSRKASMTERGDTYVTLYDIERVIGEEIDDWVASVTDIDAACMQLERFTHKYQSFTRNGYDHGDFHDADHTSIASLTTIELWVALDKLLIKEIPILADYSPEVPFHPLCRLLLRDAVAIHRLRNALEYLSTRHTQTYPGWSVFSNEFTKQSFPCRYYDQSPSLQNLKARIQDGIPSESLHAKVFIFELHCPVSFAAWRSVTCLFIRVGVYNAFHKRQKNDVRVCNDPVLKAQIGGQPSARTRTSLFSNSSKDRLYYVYQDPEPFDHHFEYAYELPSGPYRDSRLQEFLGGTAHTSNDAVAAQVLCDPKLSLPELIAFAQLRSGGSLQWLNILRELRSRTLDFRHQEIYLLLAQASSQVGPLDDLGEFLWHQELQDTAFCHAVLDELDSLFIDVGVGSSDGPAMAVISLLVGVVAARSPRDSSKRAIQLLHNVRRKTFGWVQELLNNARMSPLNQKSWQILRDMAAVCRSTFDVGPATATTLFRSSHDIEAALACAMLMWTTVLTGSSGIASTFSQVLLNRDRRLSYVLEGKLREALKADATDLGVDRAVQLVWPGYRPGPRRWQSLPSPNSQWLVCEAAPTGDKHSQTLHINLLDGYFLVGGRPIYSTLPGAVTSDPTYHELLGTRNFIVISSTLPGMDFVAMSGIHKHQVHFAVQTVKDVPTVSIPERVILRAQSEDTGDILELIPRECFQELPKPFIEGHFHWFNLSKSVIEIRPAKQPWEQCSDNWMIHLQPQRSRVTKGSQFLVDKHNPTWKKISSHFLCIEKPEYLIITASSIDKSQALASHQISVLLPRYSLSFFVNEAGILESHDFKDMVYDENQCIGTLFGLVNRLILRPKTQIEANLMPKTILIPHSSSLRQDGDSVLVELPSSGPVRYYTYQVDSDLGCLKGIVDMESRLYLARLHVHTSGGCRPDPLTGRTGIEEAISLIWSTGAGQEADSWCSTSQSPQIRYAFSKVQRLGPAHALSDPSEVALLREAYLFPSEVASSLKHPRRETKFDLLLHERPAPNLWARNELPNQNSLIHTHSQSPSIDPLRQLVSSLRTNESMPPFQKQYISRLHGSMLHFCTTNRTSIARQSDIGKPRVEMLRKHYAQCRVDYADGLERIKLALGPKTPFEQIIEQCSQWPRVTPFILFRSLASTSPVQLPGGWKKCLIDLALFALELQRARRLLRLAVDGNEEELCKESDNKVCDEWDPAAYPDWLLIQLQGDFLIRRVQADVAREIMFPHSGKNITMQVNMGEGKTSVILPMCAIALADGDRLVRVVLPKALIPQTLQILSARLCGLIDRPIYHLTFARGDTNSKGAVEMARLHIIREGRGIVVMQPEHVLSLKLACVETQLCKGGIKTDLTQRYPASNLDLIQRMPTSSLFKLLTENTHVFSVIKEINEWDSEPVATKESIESEKSGKPMAKDDVILELQKLLETHTRDILDESDDILRPQFQLIYTMGNQHPFEGSPGRWVMVQQLLALMKQHASLLSASESSMIRSYASLTAAFPEIHVLQAEGGEQLMSLIAEDVLDGRLSGLGFHPGIKGAIREFILRKDSDIHPDTVKLVEEYARPRTIWGSLLLLRGLLAHNMLLFALTQRRWRVDYGLDPSSTPRTMLAIPYRAKDVPTEQAEFGHPDVTILLTCLSHYYRGLNEEQLKISFGLLLQQDDPFSEYALWLDDCDDACLRNLPRDLSGVNIRSMEQWDNYLFPVFSRNKRAIDLYLSKVVFPSHAKEFPHRLMGSSWDIAEHKNHPVTGFSGTSDGHYLLPTSIVQYDPDHLCQIGSNAKVLAGLLQPENSAYTVTAGDDLVRWSTLKLLSVVVSQNPPVRVLLDVGAQILDLSNLQVAEAWLDYTPATETHGAIYFSEDDTLMVLTRNGMTQPLSLSPLAQQLYRCVTYLDDAHTRGTDLNFPRGFRAAVTLGHRVTKDHLVQGCARMRKLGHGHSVMFFAPHGVDQKIRSVAGKGNRNVPVNTSDILHWAIHETWDDIQWQAPYWAQKGMSHRSRYEAWFHFCQNPSTLEQLAEAWVQPELKSLAYMYMPTLSPHTASTMMNLPQQIRDCCTNFGILSLPRIRMDEEQEREVSREIEREREVEKRRPSRPSPASHSLHPDVIQLVRKGIIPSPSKSNAFRHIFATDVTAASGGPHPWSPYILATADFCKTIRKNRSVHGRLGDYLRPVQWVLSAKVEGRETLVLFSPFEANTLMQDIRISKHVHLHLYIPRTTKRMQPSDDLRLYSIPPLPSDWVPPWDLIDQLNVFAGQMYLSDYTAYVRVCRFLGIQKGDPQPEEQEAGSVAASDRSRNLSNFSDEQMKKFEGTPLPLVMQLLAIRRGIEFSRTHIGRIIDGWPLAEEDFQSPPDHVASITIGFSEQEKCRAFVELSSIDGAGEIDEEAPITIRKRALDSERGLLGRQSKRRRLS